MPFDPTFPLDSSTAVAAQMRAQLNALKALIDAVVSITGAQVDGVTTLPPGDAATVTVALLGSELRFAFGIPKGETGPTGPAFAQAVVDSVTTVGPFDPASAGVTFDGTNVRFSFAIPRGQDGSQGGSGADGMPGPQGPPGDVSLGQLNAAIAGSSANSNTVSTLGQVADGAYSQSQIQDLINKVDQLILALRR